MKDANKTKKQLIEELSALRRRVARIEGSEVPPLKETDYRSMVEQRTAELKKSEEQLRMMKTAFEQALDPIVFINPDGRFIYANEASVKESGYPRDKLLSLHTYDIGPDYTPEIWLDHFQELKRIGSMRLQNKIVTGGGDTLLYDVRSNYLQIGEKEFIHSCGRDITELIMAQQALTEQIEFERLIAEIAAELAQAKPEKLEEAIDAALQNLGRFLHTERAFLAKFSDDGSRLLFANMWAAEGVSLRSQIFKMDLASEFPWIAQQIRSGRVAIAGPGLTGLPAEAKEFSRQLKRDGINSGVVVPVQVEDKSIAMLGLDNLEQPREYPQPIVDRLRIVADIIGSTLWRARSQIALQESLNQIKKLHTHLEQENIYLQEEIKLQHRHSEIIGSSKAVNQMLGKAEQVANTDSTVLILGETGTGKELLASAIHRMSSRSHRPMITVNCAALPATLIESEMFGREKGAFTGAMSERIGRFEVADGSTIFLDEIGELTPDVQMKLLRVLEKGDFERLGSNKTIKVNVRIIAATNRDLVQAVHDGSFRRDLFYRLNVFPINVPSLQDRLEDLELLVWAFVKEYGGRMGKRITTIPKKSLDALKRCPWQGNIRELRNVIEQSMIITKGSTLEVQLPGIQAQNEDSTVLLKDVERNHILKIMKQTGWRIRGKQGSAELLGLKPTTLESRMKKLQIVRPK